MEQDTLRGRRTFLKAGVAVAGATFGAQKVLAGEQAVAAATSTSVPDGAEFDVIVIGAGFAGLAAARDCAQRGAKTLLVEARNRIGGRTFTTTFAGKHLELGGTWIHWTQPFVWTEVQRYGLSITESPGFNPDTIHWLSQGKLKRGSAAKVFPMLGDGVAKFCNVDGHSGRTVFPRAADPFFSKTVGKYDGLSMQDRLDQLHLPPDQRALVGAFLALDCHNDPRLAGAVDQLKWWSLGDFDMERMNNKLGRYKIVEGTSGLAHAMLGDAKVDLLLSTPVRSVRTDGGLTTVTTTGGRSYKARAVISTVPMNVLKTVEFSPPLSAPKMQASREEHIGKGAKCYIHIKQKVGNWMGYAPFPHPITAIWTDRELDDGTLLVCFGPPGKLDINDEAAVQTALRALLPGAEVVSVTGYQWTEDPFSRGTWAMYRPNQYTRYLDPLGEREGNVFFASSDCAHGWKGFIDGAIEGGVRAAHDVVNFLRG
jgi:monoamine oxidase